MANFLILTYILFPHEQNFYLLMKNLNINKFCPLKKVYVRPRRLVYYVFSFWNKHSLSGDLFIVCMLFFC